MVPCGAPRPPRAPAPRRPVPAVAHGGLGDALLAHIEAVGAEVAFNFGAYEVLTRDKAVHAPSLANNAALVGGHLFPRLS